MKISYNYINLVALGNFNPGIVTPDFLNKVCELNLGEPTDQSPPEIPVHKRLKFKNLIFTVDMQRLEISEIGAENIYEVKIKDMFDVYYERLPYTPLSAVGVNINCELPKTDILIEKIVNPETYLDFLNAREIEIAEKSLQTQDEKTWLSSNYLIKDVRSLTRQVSISKKKDSLNINYNYEAGGLGQNKERLKLLLSGYKEFCDEFLNFVDFLGV